MHVEPVVPSSVVDDGTPWYKLLTRYHWFVLFVSVLGWMFDTMDQQLFNLARAPAINELMGESAAINAPFYGGLATCIFMLGWATGGIIFGILGDRWGRAKVMVLTILVYSVFTGLSALSQGFWDFALYRFLTGLGVGGEFAVGVSLVAEVMPERARPHALGWLQACSAIGNITAACVGIALAPLETAGLLGDYKPWRIMFLVGALPALLALIIRRRLKEPERWLALRDSKDPNKQLGSVKELFGNPTYRRNAIVGLILATSGVVGLWGIGFFGFDLVRYVFNQQFREEVRSEVVVREERQFLKLLLSDPAAKEDVKKNEEVINKTRLEHAGKALKGDAFFDPAVGAVFPLFVKLAKEEKPAGPESIRAALTAQRAKEEKEVSPEESKLLDELRDDAEQTDLTFPEAFTRTRDRYMSHAGRLTLWSAVYGLLFNIGAFFGIYMFKRLTTTVLGRKSTFAIAFVLALLATAFTFLFLSSFWHIFWMVPIMGFFQISLFGGYAIYFPELFPTRLRSTGTSFCYNVGRYLAAPGPLLLGVLASTVFGHLGQPLSMRIAGLCMCSFFLIGLAALPFAPETKGKPLPE